VFGDIALALGPEFKKYMEVVLNTLQQASQARVDRVSHTYMVWNKTPPPANGGGGSGGEVMVVI